MSATSAAERLRVALEMSELGEQLVRSWLRRERPGLTDAEVQAEVERWRQERPGAPYGDWVGGPSTRFEFGTGRK